jgi:hypothetical protein
MSLLLKLSDFLNYIKFLIPGPGQIYGNLVAQEIQLEYTLANLTDTHQRRGLFAYSGGSPKNQ